MTGQETAQEIMATLITLFAHAGGLHFCLQCIQAAERCDRIVRPSPAKALPVGADIKRLSRPAQDRWKICGVGE